MVMAKEGSGGEWNTVRHSYLCGTTLEDDGPRRRAPPRLSRALDSYSDPTAPRPSGAVDIVTKKKEIFVSVDVEASGPIPGEYSLLSIGACHVDKPDQNAQYQAELFRLIRERVAKKSFGRS
jgi:hypothetical protein